MAKLELLGKEDVVTLWPILKPYFQSAIDRCQSGLDVEQIQRWALNDQRLIWIVTEGDELLAALSGGTREYPGGLIAYIDQIGGRNLEAWLPGCLTDIEDKVRAFGATILEINEGRMGWERRLRGFGYRPARVILRKALR